MHSYGDSLRDSGREMLSVKYESLTIGCIDVSRYVDMMI
jgi:hypothetical protein